MLWNSKDSYQINIDLGVELGDLFPMELYAISLDLALYYLIWLNTDFDKTRSIQPQVTSLVTFLVRMYLGATIFSWNFLK